VQQLIDGPLMRSTHRWLLQAWTAFAMANCFVLVERFENALSTLLQYSKSTDSNTVHDSCTACILVFMYSSVSLIPLVHPFILFILFYFILFYFLL
jgi:hypothetical protein